MDSTLLMKPPLYCASERADAVLRKGIEVKAAAKNVAAKTYHPN
jgi:hypothetical protein